MGNIFFERRGGKKLVAPISNHWRGAGMKIPIFKKILSKPEFSVQKEEIEPTLAENGQIFSQKAQEFSH